MTLEQGAIAALTAVTTALGYLFKLLWDRSQKCEADRDKQQEQIAALNKAVGLAEGEVELMHRCPAPACPWRPTAQAALVVGGIVLALFAFSSCALPFARTYSLNYSPDGKQMFGGSVHFDASPLPPARTAGADNKVIKPPIKDAEALVVPAQPQPTQAK